MDELSLDVYRDFRELEPIRSEWDNLVISLESSIYMCYDWCKTWWDFYGSGKELRIFIFRQGGLLSAIVPMYKEVIGPSVMPIRIARLVGANIPPKVFNPPVGKEVGRSVFQKVSHELIGSDGCDIISFGPVSSVHHTLQAMQDACLNDAEFAGSSETSTFGVHTTFYLPKTYDEYLGSLNKNERKNRRKYELRHLRKKYDVRVDIKCSEREVSEEFPAFVNMHAEQWRSEGRLGHFKAWPKAKDFNIELARTFAKRGDVRLIRLLADGHAISYEYAYAFGNSFFWELPARVKKKEFEQYSLGRTSLTNLIRIAIEEGKTKVEGGLGYYEYKLRLGASQYPVYVVRIASKKGVSRIRKFIYSCISQGVDMIYHKVWYRRVQPRLPANFRKPIWHPWIRMLF